MLKLGWTSTWRMCVGLQKGLSETDGLFLCCYGASAQGLLQAWKKYALVRGFYPELLFYPAHCKGVSTITNLFH